MGKKTMRSLLQKPEMGLQKIAAMSGFYFAESKNVSI